MEIRTKTQVIELLGNGNVSRAARALGFSPQALQQWGEILNERQINQVIGAAVRRGLLTPKVVFTAWNADTIHDGAKQIDERDNVA